MARTLSQQNSSYRQGVVLGLTMAEIMLLLVFILLLVTSAILRSLKEDGETTKEISQLLHDENLKPSDFTDALDVVKALKQAMGETTDTKLREVLKDIAQQLKDGLPPIPKDWQKLIEMEKVAERLGGIDHLQSIEEEFKALQNVVIEKGYSATRETLAKELPHANDGKGHEWPPIIRMSEADGFSFQLGSAELDSKFQSELEIKVIPRLVVLIDQYKVDVVEVVGHTDQVPMIGQISNLDKKLVDALVGSVPIDELVSSDNAGLGLSRAAAVVKVLLRDQRLGGVRILPLSGAQLISLDETLDTSGRQGLGGQKARRRIEIRLRRSTSTQTLSVGQ